ncbi:MAG: hypothetical protein H0W65_02160 [Sphingomonas sp.]|uniref:hypothetical protein n=1 Tax=Sphingomonas sp. TaxID=28214 RepID=UPI00182BF61C|nr:hypothetical protein [Sphingomonas sp.]MBA3666512.1 hypothetical protein [Sphingomonas sp.]
MLAFTTDQWIIVLLVFVLGLLVGGFLFSGGGRRWKTRYNAEVDRRVELEKTHTAREREWREQDSLRTAADRDRERALAKERAATIPVAAAATAPVVTDVRDTNNDGVVTRDEKPVGFVDRLLGRDRDGDGVADSRETPVDRDGDGIDDRKQ